MPNDLSTPSAVADGASRPLQLIDWHEKDKEWYQRNIEFCIKRTNFNFGAQTEGRKDLRLFYEVYNNQFPLDWFTHITNPLSTKKEAHKAFPAKIRPVAILRPNLDLLLAEYPRRPFIYNVENLGEDGYSTFMDQMWKKVTNNVTQHFIQAVLQQKQENGEELNAQQMQQLQQQPPLPDKVQEEFQSTYKDALTIKAQKWLKRTLRDKDIKRKIHRMFKDWLIAGQCYSYKGVINNELEYYKVSPLNIDFDKSEDQPMVEDGEWVVARYLWTLSDVVDRFYQEMTKQQQQDVENKYWSNSPMGYYENMRGMFTDPQERNKIPVYHCQWKGKKKIGFLSYLDMETMQYVEEEVDEDYVVDRDKGEQVEWRWVNELYEGWRVGQDMYVKWGPAAVPRTELNNHSHCKLNYNGRKFSDTHSENISLLEIGLPFQILYIIVTYILEKTIAKSKGKILLMDINAIPDNEEWDDEKFFYYSEALGYGLLDRSNANVDKTWNQYQVVDMSLFDQIKQLIELQAYCKQQWDDTCGINRQRKGETYASDGQGVNERATFQSTVMTDMIFIDFEEFVERELQGLIDFMPFLTSKGERSMWVDDDLGTQLMEIFPEDFALSQMGVHVVSSVEIINKLKQAEGVAQAMVQNKAKASTVLEMINSDNMAEIIRKLKQAEAIEVQIAQQTQQSEQDHEKELEEIQHRHAEWIEQLKEDYMNAEYDRKEDLAVIEGTLNVAANDKDNPEQDTTAALQLAAERDKIQADMMHKREERNIKKTKLKQDQQMNQHQMNMDHANLQLQQQKLKNDKIKNDRDHINKQKELAIKNKIANKPVPKSSK